MHPLCDIILRALRTDLEQMLEEGHDREALQRELNKAQEARSVDALLQLQEDWWHRPSPPDFPYDEPSDWESISAGFPDPESHARFPGSDDELADRILAAWRGRCVGCQLGKPLEGTGQPEKIRQVLETVGSWPLEDYMNPVPEGVDRSKLPDCDFFKRPRKTAWTKGNFDAVAPDDDIHYALIGQKVLEEHGPEFTAEDVVREIVARTPGSYIFAAGRNMYGTGLFGLRPPYTALFGNPCRQSLGAQIRCDPWGWGAPANPALAARMAYKDASSSQTRNGIYSGIFFAVMMADCLAHGDPARAVDAAESYVPSRSRFAEMIRFVGNECAAAARSGRKRCPDDAADWQEVTGAIHQKYADLARKFNHSIPNAAIVIAGVLAGRGEFTKTLGVTVMSGLDTDCTGATAGSIMGCALGTKGIPSHWTDPLNDTIRTELAGMRELRISQVAGRTYEIAERNVRRDR